jgi:hypothetical protein
MVQDGVTVLDQSHQVLSIVVSVRLLLEAVDVLNRRGEDRDGYLRAPRLPEKALYKP